MNTPAFTSADAFVLLPAILLALFACGTLLIDVVGKKTETSRRFILIFGMIGLAITAVSVARQWSVMAAGGLTHFSAAQGAISVDGLSFFSNAITLAITALFFHLLPVSRNPRRRQSRILRSRPASHSPACTSW